MANHIFPSNRHCSILFDILKPENVGLTTDIMPSCLILDSPRNWRRERRMLLAIMCVFSTLGPLATCPLRYTMGAIMGCLYIYSFTLIIWKSMSLEICLKEANSLPELVALAYGRTADFLAIDTKGIKCGSVEAPERYRKSQGALL